MIHHSVNVHNRQIDNIICIYHTYIYIYCIYTCIYYDALNIPKPCWPSDLTSPKPYQKPAEIRGGLGVADHVAAAGHVDGHGPWEYPLRSPREQRPHRDAWGALDPWVEWFHRVYLWWFRGDIMEYIYIYVYMYLYIYYIYIWYIYMIYIWYIYIWYIYISYMIYIYIHKQETWLWGWLKWDTPRRYGIVW